MDMCEKILHNHEWYSKVPMELIDDLGTRFKSIIREAYFQQLIDKDLLEYLAVKWPITATFYALPKVHKSIARPQGLPIVSGIGS